MRKQKCNQICSDPDLIEFCEKGYDEKQVNKIKQKRIDEIKNCPLREIFKCNFPEFLP